MTVFETISSRMLDWLSLSIPRVIAAIVIFLVMLVLAGLAARSVERIAQRRRLNAESILLLMRLTRGALVVLGVIWALQQVHFDLTAFLAGLGIVGFTVGFALQDISSNFVAGVLLLWQRVFEIGDMIEVSSFTGTVINITLRSTELRTRDGLLVLIPNATVFTNPIINHSRVPRRRLALKAWAQYDNDLEEVSRVALDALNQVPSLTNAQASVVFESFSQNAVNFTLYFWITVGIDEISTVQDQAVKALKAAFDKAGITLKQPQLLVTDLQA